jgi:hypothetical protein
MGRIVATSMSDVSVVHFTLRGSVPKDPSAPLVTQNMNFQKTIRKMAEGWISGETERRLSARSAMELVTVATCVACTLTRWMSTAEEEEMEEEEEERGEGEGEDVGEEEEEEEKTASNALTALSKRSNVTNVSSSVITLIK